MTIRIEFCRDVHDADCCPLLCLYDNQASPQPAFLFFRPGTDTPLTLVADYISETGSNVMSSDVFNGKELRFSVDPLSTRQSLLALAEDETLANLLTMIQSGFTFKPESNSRSWIERCEAQVESYLADALDTLELVDATHWIDAIGCVSDVAGNGSIARYIELCRSQATRDGKVLVGDFDEAVIRWCVNQVQIHSINDTEEDASICELCQLLGQYDSQYQYLLDDYRDDYDRNRNS